MRIELHKRVFLNFVLVIALFGILGSLVGARLISRTTLNEVQRRVSLDLRLAWSVLQSELDKLGLYVSVLDTRKRIKEAYAAPDPNSVGINDFFRTKKAKEVDSYGRGVGLSFEMNLNLGKLTMTPF